jgi:hypothetical protein
MTHTTPANTTPANTTPANTTPANTTPPSFGIATAPQQVGYDDLLRVWQEADAIGEIVHA